MVRAAVGQAQHQSAQGFAQDLMLRWCFQVSKQVAHGYPPAVMTGGTEKLREALRSLQRQQQQQQSLSSSTLGSSALVPLAPLTDQLYSGMAALDLQNHQHEQYPSQDRAEAQSAPQQIHQDNQPCQRLLRPQQQTPQSGESCSSTTRPTADGLCHRNDLAQPVGVSLPKLTQLSVGWGWSSASIAALLLQSDCLTSFNAGELFSDHLVSFHLVSCYRTVRMTCSIIPCYILKNWRRFLVEEWRLVCVCPNVMHLAPASLMHLATRDLDSGGIARLPMDMMCATRDHLPS